jgi:uncharacterized protein
LIDFSSSGTVAYCAAVLFCAYLVRGIAGFGSGLIAVPLLAFVAPITAVVPLVVCLDYLGSISQGLKNRTHIAGRELVWLWPFMLIGVGAGLYLLKNVPTGQLTVALGVFILVYAIYQLIAMPDFRVSRGAATYSGFFGGMVGALFGAGGPFYAMYFNMRGLEKTAFRATFATNYLIDGGVRLAAYALAGLLGHQLFGDMIVALPIAAAGLWIGGRIHTGLSQRVFVRMISALLIVSGSVLITR